MPTRTNSSKSSKRWWRSFSLLLLFGCKTEEVVVALPETPPELLARWDGLLADLEVDAPFALAHAGGPTVLAFWATYCPPCLEEMPMFDALHRQGHRVIGLSMDATDPEERNRVLSERKPIYPQAVLTEASMKAIGLALPAGLPFTVVLDRKGKARVILSGKAERAEVVAAIRRAGL